MFILKFFESLFAGSLKDKPGPSFFPAYILAWSYSNASFLKAFLITEGGLEKKFSAAIDVEVINMFFMPLSIAIAIVVIIPWFRNIGLAAREFSDLWTQELLKYCGVRSYKTAEEYEILSLSFIEKNDLYQKSQLENVNLTAELENEKLRTEEKLRAMIDERAKVSGNHNEKVKQLNKQLEKETEKIEITTQMKPKMVTSINEALNEKSITIDEQNHKILSLVTHEEMMLSLHEEKKLSTIEQCILAILNNSTTSSDDKNKGIRKIMELY